MRGGLADQWREDGNQVLGQFVCQGVQEGYNWSERDLLLMYLWQSIEEGDLTCHA